MSTSAGKFIVVDEDQSVLDSLKKILHTIESLIFPEPKMVLEGLLSHFKRTTVLIVILTGITYFVHHNHLLKIFETPALDAFVRLNPIELQYTTLVDINDQDLQSMFAKKRQLNPEKLKQIIEAIASGGPSVIVVDIDTSDPIYRPLRTFKFPAKIIWARSADDLQATDLPAPDGRDAAHGESSKPDHGEAAKSDHDKSEEHKSAGHGANPLPPFAPHAVLGENSDKGCDYGYAITRLDEHSLVRSYPRTLPIAWDPSKPEMTRDEETLPWRAVRAANITASRAPGNTDGDEVMFKFSAYPKHYKGYNAGIIVGMAKNAPDQLQRVVKNRIVLLGCTFNGAGDRHATPVGELEGVKLVGFAIESFLQGKVIRESDSNLMLAFDFLAGFLCVAIGHYLPRIFTLVAIPVMFPVVVLFLSLVVFDKLSIWANFVPIIFGIYLHFLHDHVVEDREMMHELEELKAEKAAGKFGGASSHGVHGSHGAQGNHGSHDFRGGQGSQNAYRDKDSHPKHGD